MKVQSPQHIRNVSSLYWTNVFQEDAIIFDDFIKNFKKNLMYLKYIK